MLKLKKLLGDADFDFPPEMSEASLTIRDLEFERDDLKKKVDQLEIDKLALCYRMSRYEECMANVAQWNRDDKYEDARSLIGGCYEVVELFDAKTPSQIEWKHKWLESARKHGASGV